ncbi:hypothetical protein [Sphingomonas paeninsulae]|nr:hypothetical protein [Sphingomonas paeninsulae]
MTRDPTAMAPPSPAPVPTPMQGLFILAAIIVGVAIYLGLSYFLQIASPYAGFLLLLYWGGLKGSAPAEFPAAFFGALGGVLLSYLLWALPLAMGSAGLVIALLLITFAVYALVMGWLPLVVNNAMMLLLTVGTIGVIQEKADFSGIAASALLGGALAGLMLLIGRMMARRKSLVPASSAG